MALLALHTSYLPHFIPAGGANECWAVLRMRDRCPLAINPCIYPLTCQFSKFSNKGFWCIIMVLKLFKRSMNWPKNHQFFHEDHPFFEVFWKQLEWTILWFWIYFKELELATLWFWNIKEPNWRFFKTSKNCPTLLPRACWLDLPLCFHTHTHTPPPKIK